MSRFAAMQATPRWNLAGRFAALSLLTLLAGCPHYTATGAACDSQVLCPSGFVCSSSGHCETSCGAGEVDCGGLCVAEACPSTFQRPGAPTRVTATAGVREASVTWTAPFDGSAPITGYTVTAIPGGATATTAGFTTAIVQGLAPGQTYRFTVIATSSVGNGPASAPSAPVTLPTVPGAPTSVVATGGIAEATVSWNAPPDGGSPILWYTVTTHPGNATLRTTSTTTSVMGLSGERQYTFTVVATNAVGDGPSSGPSGPLTISAVPDAPTNVSAVPGIGTATVTWSAPFDEGSPITSYTVTASPGGASATVSAATTATVTGLNNGATYTFTVVATSAVGTGASSLPSAPITLPSVPDAPVNVVATAGIGMATVTWTAPADNGSAITSYTVAPTAGIASATVQGTTATLTGLTNGGTYSFVVSATNAVGNGPPSAASSAITLPMVPGAPTGVIAVAGVQQATVSWTAPPDGGSPITMYTVTANPGGAIVTTTGGTTATIPGLVGGTSYTFTVFATNAVGNGPPSGTSASILVPTVPGPPLNVSTVPGNQKVSVSWSPPASDGGSAIGSYTLAVSPGTSRITVMNQTSATVTGLTNGVTYTFTVFATNALGDGPPCAPVTAIPATLPGAPTAVVATAGYQSATVSWTAPGNGGSPVTSYTVTAVPGMITTTSTTSNAVVTGLTDGQTYTFTVSATNAVGTGPASTPSSPLTLPDVPGAPTAVDALPGDGQATVSWTPPTDDGASQIIGYIVTVVETGATVSTTGATTATVSGLMNGLSYTFTVTAVNAIGIGPPSAASAAVLPGTIPGAPTGVSAIPGDSQATVSWSAPASGGNPITGYIVTVVQTGVSAGPFTGTTGVVTGLTNGTSYTFTVFAINEIGNGPASAPSAPVTPATVPGAPSGVTATPGAGSATVSWTAPTNGGSPITGYTVTVVQTNATVTTAGATTVVIPGLAAGQSYTFTVFATNVIGNGPPSAASSPVTLPDVPGSPGSVTATAGIRQATVTWTAPANGGSGITGYTIVANPGNATATTTGALAATITGLANGGTYTFTVSATNGVGTGASATSSAVTLPNVPGAPTSVTATPGDGAATVMWAAPSSNGGMPITSYTVTSTPGNITTTTSGALTATLSGLTNGTAYSFAVFATNAVGNGSSSSSSPAVTPVGVPGAPTNVTATAGSLSATVTWTAPGNGGSAISSYTVTVVQTGATLRVNGTSATVTHLANGSSYTFTVYATNAIGNGPASAASNAVTVVEIPSAGTSSLAETARTIMADGVSSTTLTAMVEDAAGDPLPNLTVSFSAMGTGNTFSSSTAVTNASGVATSTLTSTVVQTETAQATVGSVVLQASLAVTAPPSRRIGHAMTYDAGSGVTLLFGGSSAGTYVNDTWQWDGTLWTRLAPATSPSARVGAAMAYDAARGVVVLFGGLGNSADMNDTWEWNGTNWSKLSPATSPSARDNHAMVYDTGRGVTLLFGGQNSGNYASDTWEWNGSNWTKLAPAKSPPASEGHALAYDPTTGNTTLFGGFNGNYGSDTWEWNGSTWTKQSPATSPVARANFAMTYDVEQGAAILFGGTDGNLLGDTWEWNGTTWTKLSPAASPPSRSDHGGISFDSGRGVIVLFGGNGANSGLNDTWEWNGTSWVERSPG
jgi:hypothetical protein